MARPNNKVATSAARRAVKSRVRSRAMTPVNPKTRPNGYAFVVKVGDQLNTASWRYVTFEYGDTLSVSSTPYNVFPDVTNDCHRFWKRVVIDGAFQFDTANVWKDTLRLVEVHNILIDATESLYPDAESFEEARKFGALAKLTPQEAELLGVGAEYTILKIIQSGPSYEGDEKLLHTLMGHQNTLIPEIKG